MTSWVITFPAAVLCPGMPVATDCLDRPLDPCINCHNRWVADGDWPPFEDTWEWGEDDAAIFGHPRRRTIIPIPKPSQAAEQVCPPRWRLSEWKRLGRYSRKVDK